MAPWIPFAVGIATCVVVLVISSVLVGRVEGAVAAVRALTLCAAPLALVGVVLVAVGFSTLFPTRDITTSAGLLPVGIAVGGISLGYVLALAASVSGLTSSIVRRDWPVLWWLAPALILLLAAPGGYLLLGVIGGRLIYEQSNIWIWIDLACGVPAMIGAIILALWTIHIVRRQPLAPALPPTVAGREATT